MAPLYDAMDDILDEFAGRQCSSFEHVIMTRLLTRNVEELRRSIVLESWKKFPSEIPMAIEQDPGELDDMDVKAAAWDKTLRKWKRQFKKMKKNVDRDEAN